MMIRIFTFSIALLVAFGVKAQDVDSIYIENWDFSLPDDSTKYWNINEIPAWHSENFTYNAHGRESNYICYLQNSGGSIFNVLDEIIPAAEKVEYSVSFRGRWIWPAAFDNYQFVLKLCYLEGTDTLGRTTIDEVYFDIITPRDDWTDYMNEFIISSGSPAAGKKLVLEVSFWAPDIYPNEIWGDVDDFKMARTVTGEISSSQIHDIPHTSVYPNPVKDIVMAESAEPITAVSLYNTCGQLLKSYTPYSCKTNINTSDLDDGLYLIHIETTKSHTVHKIVKGSGRNN
ncbi:MAG: T9SS type A sorting domain-containing protein [Bacteroidales bacterium]|nr:T9SS type A sorting domain-containing protein [Bacteroidales bacterium]